MKAYEAYVELEKALEIVEAHKLDQAAEMIRTGLDYIWLHLGDEEIKRLERMKKWPCHDRSRVCPVRTTKRHQS